MRPLRSVSVSACARTRVASSASSRRPRPSTAVASLASPSPALRSLSRRAAQLHCNVLVRSFSDAADPTKWQSTEELVKPTATVFATGAHYAGTLTSGASGHPLRATEDQEAFDIEFTASRLGFPAYEDHGGDEKSDEDNIREESREAATAKAERILAILRHSMTELDIGRVIHRISQFATTPRVTHQTRKQFLKSLEARFGPEHQREHELVLAFLLGQDHVIEQLKVESRNTMDALASGDGVVASEPSEDGEFLLGEREVLVPEIMGLHPELVADPKFVGVVFCYCRMACLNSQKLVRPPHGQHRHPKSSLLQVKHDFRRVLDSEGLSHFAEMMGIKSEPNSSSSSTTGGLSNGSGGGSSMSDVDVDSVDAEWEEFNLENDRIDFRMLVAQTTSLIELMKTELSDETITKMLIAMLASLKTTKLHRKIFQEMVCNIQAALPERSHEAVLRQLVPFLSGNQATYDDFESEIASAALQHHRLRHEAILRALLETRMRLGHILIHDLDAIDPMASISPKLAPDVREKVITAAWNIVSVLNDREYHVFFSRFLKHKLAWRPSRATFGQTFLDDVRKTLGPRKAEAIMPLFEEIFPHLSVETLTICRVKLRHTRKLLRESASVSAVNADGEARLALAWQPDRSVFYHNLPHGVTEKHLRASLDHIGRVKRFVFFTNPVNGPPDELEGDDDEDEDEGVASPLGGGADDDDLEDDLQDQSATSATAVEEEDDDDDDVELDEDVAATLIGKLGPVKKKVLLKALKTPRKKAHVIASDKKTTFNALVEFESQGARDRALQQALQIFGVMMGGWKEYRPVFSTPSEPRTSISIQNISFGTSIDALLREMNGILAQNGLNVDLSSNLPRGVVVTSGRMELRFASFTEAAQVVEILEKHVSQMKSRRELEGDDLFLEIARQNRRKRQSKAAKAEERKAKRAAKKKEEVRVKKQKAAAKHPMLYNSAEEEEEEDGAGAHDDDDDDDDDDDADTEEDEFDENEDAYFAAEEDAERELSEAARALRELPRPFDVTWNRPPREKNKHMYV